MSAVLNQTTAMAVDAYRELNSKKLFWITLVLSGLVVACFAAIGINEEGISVLWWQLNIPMVNSSTVPPDTFYKLMFSQFGIGFWLSWVATILALVSTASIFPDLVAGGSVDLMLSKPVSRWRLFLTKYVFGLTFVALQVMVFTTACFVVIGVRGGAWEPALFLAVPIVLLFFSYLFAFCTLIGVVTRSAIAAILMTALFWLAIFLVDAAESVTLLQRVQAKSAVERVDLLIERAEERNPGEGVPESLAREREEDEASLATWRTWHRGMFAVKTALPKTGETINLLNRALVDMADLPDLGEEPPDTGGPFGGGPRREVVERVQEIVDSRSVWWVAGTSLAFEIVVVGLAGLVFARRDY